MKTLELQSFALWSDADKLPHEVLNIDAIQHFSRSSLKLLYF